MSTEELNFEWLMDLLDSALQWMQGLLLALFVLSLLATAICLVRYADSVQTTALALRPAA